LVARKSVNWKWPGKISVAERRFVQSQRGRSRFVVEIAVNFVPTTFVKLNRNPPPLSNVAPLKAGCEETIVNVQALVVTA